MNEEELKLLSKTAAKVDAISSNLGRVNDILDEIVAVIEIKSDYDIHGIEITKKELVLSVYFTDVAKGHLSAIYRRLKDYSTLGELVDSLNNTLVKCYIKNKHRYVPIKKLPKFKIKGVVTPCITIVVKL